MPRFKQDHNLGGNMSGFTRRRTHEALKAAYWLLDHFGDFAKLIPFPPLPQRLCFLRFSVRIAENDDGLAKQVLQLFHWNDHVPMRFFRPVPRPTGRSRVDCYVQFKDLPSMRAAQSLNERSVTWLSRPIALFPSIAYDLLEDLGTFLYAPGITLMDEIVERNASECRDLEGLGGHLLPYVQWYRAAPVSQTEPVQRPKPTANNVRGKAPPPSLTAQTPETNHPAFPADFEVPLPLRSGAARGADLAEVLATRVPIPQIDEVAAAQSAPVAIAAPKAVPVPIGIGAIPPAPPKPTLDFMPPTPPTLDLSRVALLGAHAAYSTIARAVAWDIPPPPAPPVPSRAANAGSVGVKTGGDKAGTVAAAEAAAAETAALGGPDEIPPPPAEAPPAAPWLPAPKAAPLGLRGQTLRAPAIQ